MHSLQSYYHWKVELLDSFIIEYDIDHFPFNSMIKRMERWESCICQKLCKFFALNFVWQNVGSSDDVSRISLNFDRRKTWLCCVIEEGKLFILLQKVWERFVTCEGILQQQWLLRHFLQMLFIRVMIASTIPKHPRCLPWKYQGPILRISSPLYGRGYDYGGGHL